MGPNLFQAFCGFLAHVDNRPARFDGQNELHRRLGSERQVQRMRLTAGLRDPDGGSFERLGERMNMGKPAEVDIAAKFAEAIRQLRECSRGRVKGAGAEGATHELGENKNTK